MKKIQKTEWQQTLRDILWPLLVAGYSLQDIADYLNNSGILTYKDRNWTFRRVSELLQNLGLNKRRQK